MHQRYDVNHWLAEQNSMGGPLVERLRHNDFPVRGFLTTNATKTNIIDALSLALEQGDLTLLDDPVQLAELQAYQVERLPSGLIRYTAPEGMHDDCVIALALAWQGCANNKPLLLW